MAKFGTHDLFFDEDNCFRWKIQPNQTSLSARHIEGLCEKKKYTINSMGCRSTKEYDLDASTGLFLGCSISFGSGLNDEETVPALVEERLSLQCVNAAVPGYGLFQMACKWIELVEVFTEIKFVCLQISDYFRYPWHQFHGTDGSEYTYETWYGLTHQLMDLQESEPRKFYETYLKIFEDNLRILHDINILASSKGIPLFVRSHEININKYDQAIMEAGETLEHYKYIGPAIYSRLQEEKPEDLLCVPGKDHHPTRLYNEIVADVLVDWLKA